MSKLSPRETEVLRLLCDGATSDQIAHALGIAADTVNSHINNIRCKLGARNRTEAVALAFRTNAIAISDGEQFSIVEAYWDGENTVSDLIVRYGFRDLINNDSGNVSPILDSSVKAWAGEQWPDSLDPAISALIQSKKTGRREYFHQAPSGPVISDLGWIKPVGRSRFLIATLSRGG